MGTTTKLALPYPELADPADVPIDMRELAEAIDGLTFGAPLVGALPGSPADGQECCLQNAAMAALGVVWRLRYRAGGGSYKWEFVGGSALYHRIATDEVITEGANFVDAPTAGPQLTLPVAGDYNYQFSANVYVTSQTASTTGAVGLNLAAAPAQPDYTVQPLQSSLAITLGKPGIILAQPASRLVKVQYQIPTVAGGTAHARMRELQLTPVRVG